MGAAESRHWVFSPLLLYYAVDKREKCSLTAENVKHARKVSVSKTSEGKSLDEQSETIQSERISGLVKVGNSLRSLRA